MALQMGHLSDANTKTGLLPIRMQWWKDAVNSVYRDKPVKHPVIQALAQVWVARAWPVLGLFSCTATHLLWNLHKAW